MMYRWLTSSALLVELLLADWPGLDDKTVAAFSPALALVLPFITQECLPCPDHLFLIPTSLNSLFDADVDAQRLKCVVPAVHGSQVASSTDIIEVECVGACQVRIERGSTGLEGCMGCRGQRGGVDYVCDGDLQQESGSRSDRC